MTPEIPVRIGGDERPFRRSLRRADRDAQSFSRRLASNGAMMRGWAAAFVVAGAAAGVMAKKTLEVADSIDKAARAANIGAERLQTLRFAAEQSGISADKMDTALSKFNVTLGKVASGMETKSSTISLSFEKLGLSVAKMRDEGLSTEQMLDQVLTRLAGVEDGAEQAAIAAQLFGRSAGPEMRNLLVNGVEGMAQLEQSARDAGNVIDEALITRGVEIADKWHSIMSSMARSSHQFALRAATSIDNAFGFTDSGKMDMLRGQLDEMATKRQDLLSDLDWEEDRATRSLVGGGEINTGLLRASIGATEEEMNIVNQQLLDLQAAKAERDKFIAQLAGGVDPLEREDLPGTGGGGGGDSGARRGDTQARLPDFMQDRLAALQEYVEQEKSILALRREEGLIGEEAYQEKLLELENRYAQARGRVARMEAAARVTTVLGAGADILGALGAFNEKALKVSQVFGAAQALISTYQGQAEALKLPFPANLAAAAAIGAKGLALVGAIRSVSAGGGGGAGVAGGGAAGAVATVAAQPPLLVSLGEGFSPDSFYSGSQIGTLLERLMDEAGDRGVRFA